MANGIPGKPPPVPTSSTYIGLIPVLLEAVKELKKEIDELKKEKSK